ncbi:ATP-binding protein [Lignipirellula cremea]|uniref:Anti-sigma F factor n=1 Tax=Lignipirellula cremea TaxID=2528010 RepID=A0A518DV80_9BACT|nr:ATP-binding protein [Lignipirellula cremea]QDU95741.1 anti-sigma F factor [Lignipirellula cremea]
MNATGLIANITHLPITGSHPKVGPSYRDCVVAHGADDAGALARKIAAAMVKTGYSDREQVAVRTAFYEAWSNAFEHGNQADPAKMLVVSYYVTTVSCSISLQDEGDGFDPAELPDPTSAENLMRECPGRGLLIMRHFMSRVDIEPPGSRIQLVLDRAQRW